MEGGFHSIKSQNYSQPGQANANAAGFSAAQYRQAKADQAVKSDQASNRLMINAIVAMLLCSAGMAGYPKVKDIYANTQARNAARVVETREATRLVLAADETYLRDIKRNVVSPADMMTGMSRNEDGLIDLNAPVKFTMDQKIRQKMGTSYRMQQDRFAFVTTTLPRCGEDGVALGEAYTTAFAPKMDEMAHYRQLAIVREAEANANAPDLRTRMRDMDPNDPAAIAGFVASGGMHDIQANGMNMMTNMMAMSKEWDRTSNERAGRRANGLPRKPKPVSPKDCKILTDSVRAGYLDISLD